MRISTVVTLSAVATLILAGSVNKSQASTRGTSEAPPALATANGFNGQPTVSFALAKASSVPAVSPDGAFILASNSSGCTQEPRPMTGQPGGGSTSKKRHQGPLISTPCNPPGPAPKPHS